MRETDRTSGAGDPVEPIAARRNRGAVVSGRIAVEAAPADPAMRKQQAAAHAASIELMKQIAES